MSQDPTALPPSRRWAPLRAISAISDAAGVGAALFLLAATLLITADLLSRNVLGRSIAGVTEMTSWMMAGMGWLALSYALRVDGHIDVRLVADRLPERVQRWLSVVVSAAAVGFMALVVRAMAVRFEYFWRTGNRGVETGNPTWWIYAVVLAGAVLFALQFVVRLLDDWHALRNPDAVPDDEGLR